MAIMSDEPVVVRRGSHSHSHQEPSEITINCPDKVGLGCDLTRIMFEFGLNVIKGDFSTDGRWCFLVFWVIPPARHARPIKWLLLKQRLTEACPSSLLPIVPLGPESVTTRKESNDIFLLKVQTKDRSGLLHDMTQVLWEQELTIRKVNVSTSPEGRAIDFFFVSDSRHELPSKPRVQSVCKAVKEALHEDSAEVTCELLPSCQSSTNREEIGLGLSTCVPFSVQNFLLTSRPASPPPSSFRSSPTRPSSLASIYSSLLFGNSSSSSTATVASALDDQSMAACTIVPRAQAEISVDNFLSPGHSVLQVRVQDRKGLVYDCLRVLRDASVQISYGRIKTCEDGSCCIDMFLQDPWGRKVTEVKQQEALVERVRAGLELPMRLALVSKGGKRGGGKESNGGGWNGGSESEGEEGGESELLVANPVERCGRGRPRVLHDVTLALREMEMQVFKADISRHEFASQHWEVYRLIIQDKYGLPIKKPRTRTYVVEQVRDILMG